MNNITNPYLIGLYTAILAAIFAVFGSFVTIKYQTNQALLLKENENKAQAYLLFLEKIDRNNAPHISQFLHIGSLIDKIGTDIEIQSFEYSLEGFYKKNDLNKLYWILNSEFNYLKLFGDTTVKRYCDDILSLILSRHDEIEWNNYPQTLQDYYKKWRPNINKEDFSYVELLLSSEDRCSIVMVSKIFNLLVEHLNSLIDLK